MLFDILILAAGLVVLVFAGDKLVEGAVALATRLRISALIVGLTVVAFGTSAPELFISLQAALDGQPGLSIGNVVGSNVANVLLVLGAPALISPVKCYEKGVDISLWGMAAITVVFMVMLASGTIGRIDGLILFAALCAFIAIQIVLARRGRAIATEEVQVGEMTTRAIAIALVIGVVGLPIGAHFTITGATGIAARFGVSDAVIGLTVVAIGTSLPELVTTLLAAIKRSSDVAIGNVIGSNIFNLAAIMGITAMVIPVPVPERVIGTDMWIMAGVTALLVGLTVMRASIGRALGGAMLVGFIVYIVSAYGA